MKKNLITYYHLWILGLITLLVAAYSPLNPLFDKAITTDQAVFFTIAEGLLDGKLAYVDFFDHKGPLLYMILALGLSFQRNMIGNFMIELIVIFGSAFFMYKIANMFAPKWISLLSVALIFCSDITLFTTANSEEYIFPLICLSVYLFLLQLKNGIDIRQVFVIGLCGMLTFFLKYNYCLIWAAIGVLLFLWMLGHKEKLLNVVKMCIAFLAGMIVATIPFLIYLLGTGSFDEFMDVYVLYSLHYAEFTGMDARINSVRFLLDTPISVYFYIAILVVSCYVLYYCIKKRSIKQDDTHKTYVLLTWFMILSLAILAVTASPGQSWYYYKQGAIIIFVVPIAFLANFIYGVFKKRLNVTLGVVIVMFGLIVSIHSRLTSNWYQITTDHRFASAMTICELIDECCDEDDTMISFSNDCTMYFYSDSEPASRIFFPSASVVDEGLFDELMNDLNENRPKIVTFQADWQAGLSERVKSETMLFIEKDYSMIYEDEFRTVYMRNE